MVVRTPTLPPPPPSAGRWRAVARALNRLPDRLLHPWRRRVAREALTSRGLPRLTLVVCHGNICRSPYAAAVLGGLLHQGRDRDVVSAGFIGPDRPAPPEAVSVARARGVDLSRHRSRLLLPSDVRA